MQRDKSTPHNCFAQLRGVLSCFGGLFGIRKYWRDSPADFAHTAGVGTRTEAAPTAEEAQGQASGFFHGRMLHERCLLTGAQMAQPPVALHCQGENCCEIGHGILGFCLPEGMKYESSNKDNGQQVLSAVPFLRAGNPGPEQQAAVNKGCEVASQPGEKGLAGRREQCFCEPGQGSFIVFCKNLIDPKALKGGVVPLRCVLSMKKTIASRGACRKWVRMRCKSPRISARWAWGFPPTERYPVRR